MLARRTKTLTLLTMCLGTFMAILDTSLVNLGLHSIQADLSADTAALQWVIDLYNLVYAALILTGGTLGDLYGRRRIFNLGVLLFGLGSIACALAPSVAILIAGRGVAGLGAALELPGSLAILNITYPDPQERTRAIAIWGGMNGLAMAIGPTLGGALVDGFGWRSLFFGILPFVAATLALGLAYVPESSHPEGRRFDLAGQLSAIVALGALSFGFIQGPGWGWSSPAVLLCLAAALAGIVAFVIIERRVAGPLVPLEVFRNAPFTAAVADAALMTFGMYGLLFILPLFLQAVDGDSAIIAGVKLLPMSLVFFVVSPLAGRIAPRFGPRILIGGGMTLTGLGLLALTRLAAGAPYAAIGGPLGAIGLGLGLITGPIATLAVANAPAARSGMSSGLVNVGRMIGATLGVAVLGVLFGPEIGKSVGNPAQFVSSMHGAFLIGGIAELLGATIAIAAFRHDSLAPRGAPAKVSTGRPA